MELIEKGKGCVVFGFGKLKFKNVDKTTVDDQEHVQDYENAEVIRQVRLGKLCLYFKEFGKTYCVPYSYIDRSFTRVSECQGNDFMADTYYYRLILVHDSREFTNLIFEKEADVDRIHARLREIRPEIEYGFVAAK